MTALHQIPVLEFRSLLHEIRDSRPDIGIRMRVMGETWQPLHLHIFQITEKGVALYEEVSRKLAMISDLTQVMEFELNRRLKTFNLIFIIKWIPPL